MGLFKIYKSKNKTYSILFKINNRIEFFSVAHKSKTECLRTINDIKKVTVLKKTTAICQSKCGSWVFKIISPKSQEIIGESQTYLNKKMAERRLMVFKESLKVAHIDSETYSI